MVFHYISLLIILDCILFIWYYTLNIKGVLEFSEVINADMTRFNGRCESQKI